MNFKLTATKKTYYIVGGCAAALALAGAAGALSEPDYLRQTAEKIIATRARTTAALRAMGFQVADSAANFLFVSHPAVAAKTLLEQVIRPDSTILVKASRGMQLEELTAFLMEHTIPAKN